jgi:hypothetical protein
LVPKSGDLALCDVVSQGDFAFLVGAPINQIKRSLASNTAVLCEYVDTNASASRGTIEFQVSSDASTARNAFIAARAKSSATDIAHLGDAAYWSPLQSEGGTDGASVTVLKAALLVVIQTYGNPATAWPEGQHIADLILSRV